jgi:phage shock protein E
MTDLIATLKSGNATIVDVRTPEEYSTNHVKGSINIPLHELPFKLDAFKKMQHIVLCCASGGRSGQATQFLKQNGIDCINGGSWLTVNQYKN